MDKVAIAFANRMGNFIYLTAAIKILRKWGYANIDLITDPHFLNTPAFQLARNVFDNVVTVYDENAYDRIFLAGWSTPRIVQDSEFGGYDKVSTRSIHWQKQGIHEVQLYLNMIGASWTDFDGFVLDVADEPLLQSDRPRIALANCSDTKEAELKGWNGFSELATLLVKLDYTVILVGTGSELSDCPGINFVDRLTIQETAKVIQQCDLLIAPATGLAIVADAVGTPVLQLDGPIPSTKMHPLQVPYKVIRSYIACAPCFQSPLMNVCTNPICMDSIKPHVVINTAIEMLNKKELKQKFYVSEKTELKSVPEVLECEGTVAYLVACFNRYHLLEQFLASFKNSYPQEGAVLFLNDASSDPRVIEAIHGFSAEGLETHYFETDYKKKLELMRTYKKMPSAHAYNRLFQEAINLENGKQFGYFMILDPDSIMHPYWVQKQIITFQEAKKEHKKLGLISGFNNKDHPIYDQGKSEVFRGSVSNYRLRKGVNLQFMMERSFFDVHGFYDLEFEHATLSSDLPKNEHLSALGYRSLILVPSMLQQLGAYDSSLPRRRSNELAEDF